MLGFKISKENIVAFIVCVFTIFSILDAPILLRLSLYLFSLLGLFFLYGSKQTIYDGFVNYYPYLVFTLICSLSFCLIFDFNSNSELSRSPQIENILAMFLMFIFLVNLQHHYKYIMNCLIIIMSFFLCFSLPIHYFYYESNLLSATFFFTNMDVQSLATKTTLGLFLSILLPYCIYRFKNNLNPINFFIVILFCVAIFYTFSRSATILAAVSIFLILILGGREYFKSLLFIFISLIALSITFQISPTKYNLLKIESYKQVVNNYTYESQDINKTFSPNSARWEYIIKSFDGFKEKPIFGHGFGQFRYNSAKYDSDGNHTRSPVTHNDYAQILYEQGLVGFISFIFLFLFNFYRLKNSININKDQEIVMLSQLILIALSLNTINLFDHPIFWILMALTLPKKIKVMKNK